MLINIAAYTLLLINVFLFLKDKKSIYVTIATLLLIVVLFAGMSLSDGDHVQYRYEFDTSREGVAEDLFYTYFILFARFLGITEYGIFLGLLGIVEIALIYGGLKCYTTNPHALLAISLPYIVPLMTVAIRFSLGLSVLIFASRFLVKNKWLYYLLFLIIATLCHSGLVFGIFYMFAFFIKQPTCSSMKTRIQSLTRLAVVMLMITAFLFLFGASGIFLYILSLIPSSDLFLPRAAAYLETIGQFGPLLAIFIYVSLFLYMRNGFLSICKKYDQGDVSEEDFRKAYTVFAVVGITSIIVPFMMAGLIFLRYLILPTILVAFYLGRITDAKYREQNTSLCFKMNNPLRVMLFIAWLMPALFSIFDVSMDGAIKCAVLYLGL